MPDISTILLVIQEFLAVISFLTNGFLILLIILKSPKTMGSYKYLMVFMSAFEILYGIVDLLVKPEVITKGSYWISGTTSKRSILPLEVAYPLMLFWAASFGIALALFGVHFVFRYFLLVGSEIATKNGISENEVIYFGFSLFDSTSENRKVDWMPIHGTIILSVVVTLSFITMFYFGLKGYFAIKKLTDHNTDPSSMSKKLQTQLFYSLVVQTLIPVLLIHIPTTLIVINLLMGTAHEGYGYFSTVSISLFPAIDPLPSLIIIKPYRQAIINMMKIPWRTSVQPLNGITHGNTGTRATV